MIHAGLTLTMATGWILAAAVIATTCFISARAFAMEANGGRGVLSMTASKALHMNKAGIVSPQPTGRHRTWIQTRPPDTPVTTDCTRSTQTTDTADNSGGDADTRIRILSYNVLGPKHALTPKHAYCPLTLRRWNKRSLRLRDEIREYHSAADGGLDAVCLQEVTPKTLRDTWIPFMKELGLDSHLYQPKDPFPLFEVYRQCQMRTRFYRERPALEGTPLARYGRLYSHRCLGVVIFYSTTTFQKIAERRVFMPEEAERLRLGTPRTQQVEQRHDRNRRHPSLSTDTNEDDFSVPSRLEDDLRTKPDAAVMLRLKIRDPPVPRVQRGQSGLAAGSRRGEESGSDVTEANRTITLVCCHLWFDPLRPDLKTAQCKLLFDAIERFHEEDCGLLSKNVGSSIIPHGSAGKPDEITPGKPADKGGVPLHVSPPRNNRQTEEHQGKAAAVATNLVLCGDFNSLPVVQPMFLPGQLQARAQDALHRDNVPPPFTATTDSGIPILHCPVYYPKHEASASGAYSLLAYGAVSADHPEHPDAFLPELMAIQAMREAHARDSGQPVAVTKQEERFRERHPPQVPPAKHKAFGAWTSGYERMLEDVYRDRCSLSPQFTTKTNSFSGVIDHIFVSSGEPGGVLSVAGILGFPRGAAVESRGQNLQEPTASAHRGWGSSLNSNRRSSGSAETAAVDSVARHGGDRYQSVGQSNGDDSVIPPATPGAVALTADAVDGDDDDDDDDDDGDDDENSRATTGGASLGRHVTETADNVGNSGTPKIAAVSQSFGPLPDENWGSDHLALGVELAIRTCR